MNTDAGIYLLKFVSFILAAVMFIHAIVSLIYPDWAWGINEFIAELRGRNVDTLYRTESWEFWNKVSSILLISIAVYLAISAYNMKTFDEWLRDDAPRIIQQMNENSKP